MPFIAIVIGAIIAIAAFNDAQWTLGQQLKADIPKYFVWAIAIAAILGLGFVPGMKIPSRYLIALVALVVVLKNFRQIKDGFTQFAQVGPPTGTGSAEPTSAYVQSGGAGGTPTQAEILGVANAGGSGTDTTATAANAANVGAAASLAANFANPGAVLSGFTQSIGFGGVAS